MIRRSIAALFVLIGCGGESSSPDGGAGDVEVDGATIDAAVCVGVDCADWIEAYEREAIGKLTGAEPIGPGVTLAARYSDAERDIARDYLVAELDRHGLEVQLHDYGTGANVWALLPATRGDDREPHGGSPGPHGGAPGPSAIRVRSHDDRSLGGLSAIRSHDVGSRGELLVLGAHFDSVEAVPGAADDGSGTALVLAAARYFAGVPVRDRDLVFVLFDEEELGLIGSQAFAEKLRLEGAPLVSMHNFDMISWDGDGDGGVELWSPTVELEQAYRAAAGELGIPISSVEFQSSDHAAFIGEGFDAVGLSEEYVEGDHTPHYHLPSDSYDKIDFPYLAQATRLALVVVGRLAGAR